MEGGEEMLKELNKVEQINLDLVQQKVDIIVDTLIDTSIDLIHKAIGEIENETEKSIEATYDIVFDYIAGKVNKLIVDQLNPFSKVK